LVATSPQDDEIGEKSEESRSNLGQVLDAAWTNASALRRLA
jgi:hypothetical protein